MMLRICSLYPVRNPMCSSPGLCPMNLPKWMAFFRLAVSKFSQTSFWAMEVMEQWYTAALSTGVMWPSSACWLNSTISRRMKWACCKKVTTTGMSSAISAENKPQDSCTLRWNCVQLHYRILLSVPWTIRHSPKVGWTFLTSFGRSLEAFVISTP